MPWTVGDVERHMKDLSAAEKETWVEVANKALAACEKAGRSDCEASAIRQANAVIGKVREALTPEQEDFVEAVTKTEDGIGFPASDYAYVPDREKPSTWKLRLTSKPGGTPDAGIVGAAVAALGKGFRGQKVEIPAADLPGVKAKVRAAWKKANPDKEIDDMPAVIREALTPEEEDFVEAATFKALAVGRLGESIPLREALRKALEEEDARIAESSEAAGRSEMTFEEQAGELVPQEVGE